LPAKQRKKKLDRFERKDLQAVEEKRDECEERLYILKAKLDSLAAVVSVIAGTPVVEKISVAEMILLRERVSVRYGAHFTRRGGFPGRCAWTFSLNMAGECGPAIQGIR
jgi:hypothetical protein